MDQNSIIICVGNKVDQVCNIVYTNIKDDLNVLRLLPEQLSDIHLKIDQRRAYLRDTQVKGFLFFANPGENFISDFMDTDKTFCNMEMKAILLSLLQHKNIYVLNRYSSSAWFEGLTWSFWRKTLLEQQVKVSPASFGHINGRAHAHWVPYLKFAPQPILNQEITKLLGAAVFETASENACYFIKDSVLGSRNNSEISRSVEVLNSLGIQYGMLSTDAEGKVMHVDTAPFITDVSLAGQIATKIKQDLYEHMLGR